MIILNSLNHYSSKIAKVQGILIIWESLWLQVNTQKLKDTGIFGFRLVWFSFQLWEHMQTELCSVLNSYSAGSSGFQP